MRTSRMAIALGALVAIGVLVFFLVPSAETRPHVLIGEQKIIVDIVDSDAERAQGLSGRESLAEGQGMLFVFPQDGRHGFWMKDMLFPIDIIWLDADGVVVSIVKNATPESYPRSFSPEKDARFVLEVPAGFTDRYSIDLGSAASIFE